MSYKSHPCPADEESGPERLPKATQPRSGTGISGRSTGYTALALNRKRSEVGNGLYALFMDSENRGRVLQIS
jgi:hypothetical protein